MGISYPDLIHDGNLGLMEAARSLIPIGTSSSSLTRFGGFVRPSFRLCRIAMRIFSVPASLSRAFSQIEKKFESESYSDGTPAPAEVAESLDVSLEDVNTFIAISGRDVSLSESLGEDGELELSDKLEQETERPSSSI